RKRPLPAFPRRVAIVTSPDAAALQDILNILGRRYPLLEVLVAETPVQGDAAAPGIVAALAAVGETPGIDAAIVTRGGGSLEDLWPFNEEMVARAIFACPVPVISAVGHETDVTIADLVADVRAPTPSAAAEIVAPDRADLRRRAAANASAIAAAVRRALRERRVGLSLAVDRLGERSPDTLLHRERIDALLRSARLALGKLVETCRVRAGALEAQLRALGPAGILGRGYAIVRKGPDGPVLASAADTAPGDPLDITLAKGRVEAETRATFPGS
ncbi:MAG: exodeoxyribonuclease VII large subunit, partial [Gemmatimonadetes bacterium]|nr:exodeoxyribonuclease VII large subunit [Gemmatimonadota bacterium]